jgi:hypothetical protein
MTDYHFHHPEKMFTDRAELSKMPGIRNALEFR